MLKILIYLGLEIGFVLVRGKFLLIENECGMIWILVVGLLGLGFGRVEDFFWF